ncbi:peptidoglycan endopeptidase [Novosphingobium sp. KCTC 2891]|uniref:peptidoglycan endopeptidase n=1 Tax=Novosphingobium sp. KCTC 2891 TaxID=2989730 RepID=UPI0022229AB3|nr:peptidoglycan endopeptidase [Novosphingobium sp. KCTC 2891]MCW1383219.1 peptidoglycan endopeptidase [Novosphingobium sp. KCTC 2891]
MNPRLAEAALGLVGTPYRLHGRDAKTGLDCVGLVAEALRRAGYPATAPQGYTLRNLSFRHWLPFAERNGFRAVDAGGDIALAMVNPIQPHLLIAVEGGFVHAHAGLRRVALMPGPLPWHIPLQWRIAPN